MWFSSSNLFFALKYLTFLFRFTIGICLPELSSCSPLESLMLLASCNSLVGGSLQDMITLNLKLSLSTEMLLPWISCDSTSRMNLPHNEILEFFKLSNNHYSVDCFLFVMSWIFLQYIVCL